MLVSLTFDFGPDDRRALADRLGRAEPLRHDDLRRWALSTIQADLDVIVSDYNANLQTTKEDAR